MDKQEEHKDGDNQIGEDELRQLIVSAQTDQTQQKEESQTKFETVKLQSSLIEAADHKTKED